MKAGRLLSMQRVTAPILLTERDGARLRLQLSFCALGLHVPQHRGIGVPFLAGTLYESFDIVQWCDDHSMRGDGVRLLPPHHLMDIRRCPHSHLQSVPSALSH